MTNIAPCQPAIGGEQAIQMAFAYRQHLETQNPAHTGLGRILLRRFIQRQPPATFDTIASREAVRHILKMTPEDMPCDWRTVALMVDAGTFILKTTSRADAWHAVGINPKTGHRYLRPGKQSGLARWSDFLALRYLIMDGPGT